MQPTEATTMLKHYHSPSDSVVSNWIEFGQAVGESLRKVALRS